VTVAGFVQDFCGSLTKWALFRQNELGFQELDILCIFPLASDCVAKSARKPAFGSPALTPTQSRDARHHGSCPNIERFQTLDQSVIESFV
jgi:hypothetical protein